MLINAGVNMPAPGSAGVPPAGGGRRTDFDFDPDFPISMTSRPLMVGAALAAAQVLQPVQVCVRQRSPHGWAAGLIPRRRASGPAGPDLSPAYRSSNHRV